MQSKNRYRGWDCKVHLYSPATGEIYCGLVSYFTDWAKKRGYAYEFKAVSYTHLRAHET